MKKVVKVLVGLVAIVIFANILMAGFAFWEADYAPKSTNEWCLTSQTLNPSNSTKTAILVHGFVGSPFDLKPLAKSLAKNNFKVVVPFLPGQLKKSFAYDRTKYSPEFFTNWLAEIIKTETEKNGKKPCLVGFSMGGTISTVVASQNSIKKLVLIAPFYSLKFADKFIYNSSRILRWVFPLVPKFKKPVKTILTGCILKSDLKKFREAIQKGDKVVTTGGIYGKINAIKDNHIIVEIDDNVKIKIDKSAILKDSSDISAAK